MDPAYGGRPPNGEYDSSMAVPSQAGMPPMTPMSANGGRAGAGADGQRSQQMQVGNGTGGAAGQGANGDFQEERRGGNKFLNMLMCRCG